VNAISLNLSGIQVRPGLHPWLVKVIRTQLFISDCTGAATVGIVNKKQISSVKAAINYHEMSAAAALIDTNLNRASRQFCL
jgi:hypothetical protein